MRKTMLRVFAVLVIAGLCGSSLGDGTFVPMYDEREYEGSLEQKAQEAIIIHNDGMEDLILKVTYQGKAKDFAWLIPFPSIPEISRANAELFAELFAYVERSIAREEGWSYKWGKSDEETAEAPRGVEIVARKTVGSYETTTVRETTEGALNGWLKTNGYLELQGAEQELEHYRGLGWIFVAAKVRDALAEQEAVDLHPLRFQFKTREEDGMVYPMKLSVFQRSPFDVNLYVFTDSHINIDYDEKGVLTKKFAARYEDSSYVMWSHSDIWENLPMWEVRRFFLTNYPRERFFLTNIQARQLDPADIREWPEDLYIYPQYIYLFDPSTWYWPQWLALLGGIAALVVIIAVITRLRRKKKKKTV